MTDSSGTTITADNANAVVKSSYDDVNSALENLLGNISSGTVSTVSGATVPQLIGINGRAVMQSFLATTDEVSEGTITFPTPFASGTVPFVICGSVTEINSVVVSHTTVKQNADGSLQVTNTGFNFLRSTGTAPSDLSKTVPVLAIGVM